MPWERAARTLRSSGVGLVLILLSACSHGQEHGATVVAPDRFAALWLAYQKTFIGQEGRVIDQRYADQRTTSEGQAYALFFALVSNQRERFARLLAWTQNNLAQGDLGAHLPAWLWGRRADGSWGVIDPNSAADADLWIAYTLLQAGRLWNMPDYARLGRRVAVGIAQREVANLPRVGPMLLPGRSGFGPDGERCYTLNLSYLPLPVLIALAHRIGEPWTQMAQVLPGVVQTVSPHGFTPDWIRWCPKSGFGADPKHPGVGSYDAIRIYLWAGMTNPATPGARHMLESLWGMANYLHAHAHPPEFVDTREGRAKEDGAVGFSAALLPYLQSLGTTSLMHQQLTIVERGRGKDGLYGQPPHYYAQNLALFALGYLGGVYRFDPEGKLKVNWQ